MEAIGKHEEKGVKAIHKVLGLPDTLAAIKWNDVQINKSMSAWKIISQTGKLPHKENLSSFVELVEINNKQ